MKKKYNRFDKRLSVTFEYEAEWEGKQLIKLINITNNEVIPLDSKTARKLKEKHSCFKENTNEDRN